MESNYHLLLIVVIVLALISAGAILYYGYKRGIEDATTNPTIEEYKRLHDLIAICNQPIDCRYVEERIKEFELQHRKEGVEDLVELLKSKLREKSVSIENSWMSLVYDNMR